MEDTSEHLWLENQLCFPLYAASRMMTKLYTPLLDKLEITYPQYLVLLVLWKQDSKSVSELSEQLFLESNTLTPLLKRMETKGLVLRERQKADERKVMIKLTPKGNQLKEEALCIPQKIVDSIQSDGIDVSEVLIFKETLTKVVKLLGKEQSIY